MNLGAPEILIILVIVLLLFGSTRLPKLARSLGEASKEFKKGVNDERDGRTNALAAGSGNDAAPKPDPNEQITMSRAELDRLLAERDASNRPDAAPPQS